MKKSVLLYIHFKSRSSPSSFYYHLNGKQISSIAAHNDLGLFVSADLTWRSHYQLISSRAYKMLGLLWRVFSSSVSVPAKWSLYISLVRFQLLYCSSVWHPYLLVEITMKGIFISIGFLVYMELLTFPRYNSISFCNKIQVTSIFLGSFHVELQF